MPSPKDQSFIETIVVGAGPAGVTAARTLQLLHPGMSILVLEAGERNGGQGASGLHLIDSENSDNFPVVATPSFKAPRIRWEREWVDADQVDWEDKEWAANLPQWSFYLGKAKRVYLGIREAEVEVAIKWQSPVNKFSQVVEEDQKHWSIETPLGDYTTNRVIWAAGLTAFQNAYGKLESQEFLLANPTFDADAQDFRGGIGLEISFKTRPTLVEHLDADAVFGLPVKHNGQWLLMFGVLLPEGDSLMLKTLTHVHRELLADPKEVMALQKSLRRAVRSNFTDWTEENASERWVVSSKVAGHALGMPWLLGRGIAGSLEFVGEESIAAQKNGLVDTLGALDSVHVIES